MNSRRLIAPLALSLLLAGCIGSRSTAPAYYLLTARADATAAPRDISIGVGPVRIAEFLDRAQIVTHDGTSALHVHEQQRWGEPLNRSIQRVLLQDLAALTGAHTRDFPWRQNLTPDYAVRIDVIDLDVVGGSAILAVDWALEHLGDNRIVATRQQQLQVAAAGSDGTALASAYSALLAQLAQQIAAALPGT